MAGSLSGKLSGIANYSFYLLAKIHKISKLRAFKEKLKP
jgi:hypothetical protein